MAMPSVFQTWMSLKEDAMAVFFSPASSPPQLEGHASGDLGTAQPCLRDTAVVTAVSSCFPSGNLAGLANCCFSGHPSGFAWGPPGCRPLKLTAHRSVGWQQWLPTGEQDFVGGLSLVLLLLHYTEFPSTNPFLLLL